MNSSSVWELPGSGGVGGYLAAGAESRRADVERGQGRDHGRRVREMRWRRAVIGFAGSRRLPGPSLEGPSFKANKVLSTSTSSGRANRVLYVYTLM